MAGKNLGSKTGLDQEVTVGSRLWLAAGGHWIPQELALAARRWRGGFPFVRGEKESRDLSHLPPQAPAPGNPMSTANRSRAWNLGYRNSPAFGVCWSSCNIEGSRGVRLTRRQKRPLIRASRPRAKFLFLSFFAVYPRAEPKERGTETPGLLFSVIFSRLKMGK